MAKIGRAWGALALLALVGGCEDTSRAAEYEVLFDDARGLQPGARVFVAGVSVGRVNQVELQGRQAKVTFSVRNLEGAPMTSATCAGVGWYGPGGDAHLNVEPGDQAAAPVAPGASVTACSPKGLLGKSGEQAMENADKLLSAALNGPGIISRLLEDKKLADRIERHFAETPTQAETTSEVAPDAGAPSNATVDGGAPEPAKPQPAKPKPATPRDLDPGF